MAIKLRPAVQKFAEAMEARLKENDFKGGWGFHNGTSDAFLKAKLLEEIAEYWSACLFKNADSANELIDIGNFAMMLFTREKNLPEDHLK